METINKKQTTKKQISKPNKKPFDVDKFFGKMTWTEEPVKYQRNLRDDK
jgi:hypothetical protein